MFHDIHGLKDCSLKHTKIFAKFYANGLDNRFCCIKCCYQWEENLKWCVRIYSVSAPHHSEHNFFYDPHAQVLLSYIVTCYITTYNLYLGVIKTLGGPKQNSSVNSIFYTGFDQSLWCSVAGAYSDCVFSYQLSKPCV